MKRSGWRDGYDEVRAATISQLLRGDENISVSARFKLCKVEG